jgi:hypothetical protein
LYSPAGIIGINPLSKFLGEVDATIVLRPGSRAANTKASMEGSLKGKLHWAILTALIGALAIGVMLVP